VNDLGLGAPSSYMNLQQGTPVLSKQGQQVGTVHVVVADREADVFDALVIREDEGLRVARAEEIGAIYENGVVLSLATKQCHLLPKSDAATAAGDDAAPGVRGVLRRAWGALSGSP
jgi:uncharacterized protein YrrD